MTLRAAALVLTVGFAFAISAAQDADSLDRSYAAELPRIAPLDPEAALDSFEIHPDFRIELAAAEPLVRDPVAMAFDESGRLFVVEMRGYSEMRDANIGEIRLLIDADQDGRFDRATTYAGGLAWPTAVACWNGGVFVAAAPDILYYKDADNDGVADTREVVFTGFHSTNVQGLLNSFNWSLDNRIHGATSSSGADVKTVAHPERPILSLRGRDFSFDPRTHEICAESGGAQHGLSFDAWGRKFVCSNSDHILMTLYEDRYFARNPYYAPPPALLSIAEEGPASEVFRISPVEPWRIVRTRLRVQGLVPGPIEGGGTPAGYFTSATGVTIYKGDAWPEQYRGNAFIGDVGSNLVHRKTIEEDGLRLIARRADANTEFLRSRDIWFRPVQFANGPDGNFYIADMYREVIEHPDSLPPIIKQHLDLNSGNDRGRVYRVIPKNTRYRPAPDLRAKSSEELARLIDHPNTWHRETAGRLLYERQDVSVATLLREIASRAHSPQGRLHALYAIESLGNLSDATLAFSLRDPDPRLREHAVRLAERHIDESLDIQSGIDFAANDPDPRVRYQAAFSLGEWNAPEAIDALADIALRDGGDELVRAAILSSTPTRADALYLALTAEDALPRADETLLNLLARQIGATSKLAGIEATLDRIDRLTNENPKVARANLESLARGVAIPPRGADVRDLLTSRESTRQIYAELMDLARRTATDPSAREDDRIEGIRALALDTFENARRIIEPLLDGDRSPDIQLAALETLGRFPNSEVAGIALARWDRFGPRMRSEAVELFFSRTEWLAQLLDATEHGRFNPAQIDSLRIEQLRSHEDVAIRNKAASLLAARADRQDRAALLEKYSSALTMDGNPSRGRAIFTENCAQCHRIGNLGNDVGPDLVTVANAGRDKLLTNILDPSREINPQYTQYIIETTNLQTHTGIIAAETATSVTIKRAHGETETILRVNIESIASSNLSLMPEGWEEGLDAQALADLMEFLTSTN